MCEANGCFSIFFPIVLDMCTKYFQKCYLAFVEFLNRDMRIVNMELPKNAEVAPRARRHFTSWSVMAYYEEMTRCYWMTIRYSSFFCRWPNSLVGKHSFAYLNFSLVKFNFFLCIFLLTKFCLFVCLLCSHLLQ